MPSFETDLPGSFAQLGSHFYTRLPAQALPDPYLVAASPDALKLLGYPAQAAHEAAFIARFSGAFSTSAAPTEPHARDERDERDALPYATVYSGHQFGHWAGQLGDGRALTLGEMTDTNGQPQEIQLKGSGLTPYSRMGDGRAVLRSSIREFLCSEAMHALGIPTTRALAVIGSDLPVRRETLETAAVVSRFAPSLVRFGHFEHFSSNGQLDDLRQLADHVINRHFPELVGQANPYAGLLESVTRQTADLMVQWQAVGFCHGVMNTDNMSILGLTIDYGPYGFIDGFDAGHICNHTDAQGRYAYQNQPQVAYWNLFCLAQALLPLIASPADVGGMASGESADTEAAIETAKAALAVYKPRYETGFVAMMRRKLGLTTLTALSGADTSDQEDNGDTALIDRLFQLMHANRADFTLTFRRLAAISGRGAEFDTKGVAESRDLFLDRPAFDAWLLDYRARLAAENLSAAADAQRQAAMNRVNPKYVLRNHLAETAIRDAREKRFDETRRLLEVLRRPFDEQPESEAYAGLPPDWASSLEVSCSS